MTALHSAAYDGDIDEVRRLLAAGMDANLRDGSGYTPLLWASLRAAVVDQVPLVAALVEAGADPNALTTVGDSSCLILAAQSGNEAAVEALVSAGAKLDARADGVTALMVAARMGDLRMARLLLRLGADPAIACGRFRASDYARYGGHDELAQALDTATSPREST